MKAGRRAYVGRKLKKRENRRLWQIKINAGAREKGVSYSKLMGALKKANIELNRKMLSELAAEYPKAFEKVIGSGEEIVRTNKHKNRSKIIWSGF